MLIHPLIEKYQKYILAFANTELGRRFFDAHLDLPIVKITGDSISYDTGERTKDGPVYIGHVFSGTPYLEKLRLPLTAMEIASETYGRVGSFIDNPDLVFPHFDGLILPRRDLPQIMFAVGTVSPDLDPEVNSVIGYTGSPPYSANDTWAKLRAGATQQSAGGGMHVGSTRYNDHVWALYRGFHLYYTKALDMLSFSAASWYYQTDYISSGYSNDDYYLVISNPASNTNITTADHTAITMSACANAINNTTKSLNTWYNEALNATGLANISTTGVSKFGWVCWNDYTNTDPGSGNADEYMDIVGGANRPYLSITYIPVPRGGSPMQFNAGGATIG